MIKLEVRRIEDAEKDKWLDLGRGVWFRIYSITGSEDDYTQVVYRFAANVGNLLIEEDMEYGQKIIHFDIKHEDGFIVRMNDFFIGTAVAAYDDFGVSDCIELDTQAMFAIRMRLSTYVIDKGSEFLKESETKG